LTKLDKLIEEFRIRHLYWEKNLKNQEIRRLMLVEAYVPAGQFLTIVAEDFLPAVEKMDLAEAREIANGPLLVNFLKHRAAIDKVVKLTKANETRVESAALRTVQRQRLILGILFGALIAFTIALGVAIVRSILRPIVRLERVVRDDLPRVIEEAKQAGFDGEEPLSVKPILLNSNDELGRAAMAFNSVVQSAVDLASDQARQRRNTSETFIHLGRRNQNLVSRQLRHIDELERAERDPALLKHLFRLDHLATRMRRNAESLLVLAGVEPARKWRQPVSVLDVIRSALGEVEGFERVRLQVIQPAKLPGFAVGDITHLLAELMENALRYSPPDMPVTVTSGFLESHYQIAIVDRGMGIGRREIEAANERLRGSDQEEEIPAGSFGLYVVGRLARRYNILVELESDGGEGLTAYISIPLSVLDAAKNERAAPAPSPAAERLTPATRPAVGPPARAALAGTPVEQPPAQPTRTAQPEPPTPQFSPADGSDTQAIPLRRAPVLEPALEEDPLIRQAPPVSPSTWSTASTGMTGPIDTTTFERPVSETGPVRPPRRADSMDEHRQPPQAGSDGLTYTRAGLRKRSSKLNSPSAPAAGPRRPAPVPVHRETSDNRPERPATEVRSRYDSFVAGKRRAIDPDSPAPGTTSHNPQEN
ncbi:MAG: ATP-binding protein, partial [Angustibacter sp.]